jgi:hypothetical protein
LKLADSIAGATPVLGVGLSNHFYRFRYVKYTIAFQSSEAKMGKPANTWAVVLWAIAAFLALGRLVQVVGTDQTAFANEHLGQLLWLYFLWLVPTLGPLAALGGVIDLLDEIRWNALPPEQRRHP